MKINVKLISGILAVVVIAVLVIIFMRQAEKKIKIGAVLSISGPASYVGEEVKDGMLLAVDEINSWGGIDGKKIELIIEDSKTNTQEGEEAFNKIEASYRPVLYVSTLSSVSMALAPLAEKNEVVPIGLVVTTPKLTEQNEWVFRYYATAKAEVLPILSMLEEWKVKKLGILYLNDDYGTSVFKLLKKEFERTGGVVTGETFEVKDSDFKEQIAELKDMEAIYAVGFDSNLKNVFKQLKKEDFIGFILGPATATLPSVRSIPEAIGEYKIKIEKGKEEVFGKYKNSQGRYD